jgi:predicted  nucleic acid-binding Zn-ribbon protein
MESPKEKEPPREKEPPKEPSPTEKQEDQGLLQSKEKEIEQLRNKLCVKEEEVRTLKSQIESLETIHQTIQEKKKELSSP